MSPQDPERRLCARGLCPRVAAAPRPVPSHQTPGRPEVDGAPAPASAWVYLRGDGGATWRTEQMLESGEPFPEYTQEHLVDYVPRAKRPGPIIRA